LTINRKEFSFADYEFYPIKGADMVRPQKSRFVAHQPEISYFKPRGMTDAGHEEVRLTIDEREAIRLSDLESLSYEEAGRSMGVSRATFGRIIQKARKILADALINGKAIRIEGGKYTLIREQPAAFVCSTCNCRWEQGGESLPPKNCPSCNALYFQKVSQ
jgi:predicted DNA-binding protein (UPF0251 family)